MTKKEAVIAAELLISKMLTIGWRIRVWENLGWNYCIVAKNVSVGMMDNDSRHHGMYYAEVSDEQDFDGGSPADWSDDKYYRDPNKAVEGALKAAKNFVKKRRDAIDRAEVTLGLRGR